MGVLDNDRVWNCTVRIYDLHFGNPTSTDSITAQNTSTYTNDNIKSWKITDTMSANGDVAFGSTGSKALSLELFGLSSKSFGTGAIIDITLGGAASKTWVFFVDTVAWNTEYGTTTKYTASVQAYDAMYYASSKISGLASNATTPPAIQSILASGTADMTQCKTLAQYCIRHSRYDLIRARASELSETTGDKYDIYANMYDSRDDDGWSSGNTMDDVCADSTGKIQIGDITDFTGNITISNAITGRTLLGRMAALNGLRAYCDNYAVNKVGTINFTSLMGAYYNAITTADVYDNGFISEGKKKYQYFTNGKVTYGKKTSNGFSTMSIDCPDMTQTKINALGNNFKNTEYEIGTVKFRGDPNLTSGMRLYAPDATGTTHDIVCTKVVTNYDGGLYQQIYSEGKSDSDIEFENNAYAENAEEVVDEGGGGGGTSLLYYTETTSPNSAQIEVGSNSIEVNTTAIDITGNINATGDFVSNATGGWYAKVETSNGVEIGSNNYNVLFTNNGVGMTKGASYRYPFPTANILLTGNVYSADGIIGAKCLQSQYLYGHNIGFVDKFGLASQNSGTYDNPALRWYLRPQGGDKTQLINAADVDHTFDLRSLNTAGQPTGDTITIKTNDFVAKNITSNDGYIYCDRIYSTFKDVHDVRKGEIVFSPSASSPYCKANISIGADYIRINRHNYDPNNSSTNIIQINLTATNINDLFTFL